MAPQHGSSAVPEDKSGVLRPLIISLVCIAVAVIPGVALFRPGHQGRLVQEQQIVTDAVASKDLGAGGVGRPGRGGGGGSGRKRSACDQPVELAPSPILESCEHLEDVCTDQVWRQCLPAVTWAPRRNPRPRPPPAKWRQAEAASGAAAAPQARLILYSPKYRPRSGNGPPHDLPVLDPSDRHSNFPVDFWGTVGWVGGWEGGRLYAHIEGGRCYDAPHTRARPPCCCRASCSMRAWAPSKCGRQPA